MVGTDVAGDVEAIGPRVTAFRPGDEVFGWCDGAYGEYAAAAGARLALKPAELTFDQAAAVPTAALAALQGLRDRGRIRAGNRVLIIGASGGVGAEPLSACVRALGPEGSYVVVGTPDAHSITGIGRFVKALVRSPFAGRRRLRPLFSVPRQEDLAAVRGLLVAGAVRPVIDRHYGLADAADAVRYVEAGHARGKVVICI